jgi:hypothetical protein
MRSRWICPNCVPTIGSRIVELTRCIQVDLSSIVGPHVDQAGLGLAGTFWDTTRIRRCP